MTHPRRKKRIVFEKDWHGWAWKHLGEGGPWLGYWAEPGPLKPGGTNPTENGKWVRVQIKEVR